MSIAEVQDGNQDHTWLQQPQNQGQPCVVRDAVAGWPACQLWQGPPGLQHLAELAGSAGVDVMSSQDSNFHGPVHLHQPVQLHFSDFLVQAARTIGGAGDARAAGVAAGSEHLYLAQATIVDSSNASCGLAPLQQDFEVPAALRGQQLDHINLWMSTSGSQSSLHYDPYQVPVPAVRCPACAALPCQTCSALQNLLCLVSGVKTVKLMSPAATQHLYPLPLGGESPNHSAVDWVAPDYQAHPRARHALAMQQTVVLRAGDALFIPQGWWHQVGSSAGAVAVNFWWRSAALQQLAAPHAAPFALRHLLSGMLDAAREQALQSVRELQQLAALREGVADEQPILCRQAMRLLADAVHSKLGGTEEAQPGHDAAGLQDPITLVLATLTPAETQATLLLAAHHVPRTLEALLLHAMPPAGAELLTRLLEDADRQVRSLPGSQQQQEAFYGQVYGACSSPQAAFQALLEQKERFAESLLQTLIARTLS